MAYNQGGAIEASDFNTFRSQLLSVYGTGFGQSGYGQTAITVPTVSGGFVELIKSTEWTALRNAAEVCGLHQGTDTSLLPGVPQLATGQVVVAHDGVTDPSDIPTVLANITTNNLNADPTSTSQFLGRSTQTLNATWSDLATTTVDLVWTSPDNARYFFNSGGEITIRVSFTPNVVSPQNTSWQNLLSDAGSVTINRDTVVNSGTTGTPVALGYYTITNTAPLDLLFSASPSTTAYAGVNVYQVSARTLNPNGATGDNGDTLRLQIDFDDNFTGASDTVDGTLEVIIDERRATTYLTIPSFTVSIQNALNAV